MQLPRLRFTIRRMMVAFLASGGTLAGCGAHWPPPVGSAAEILALPTSQTDLRGIGLGDDDLRLIAERFPRLDYLYLNSESKVSDEGLAHLAESRKLHQIVIMNGGRVTDAGVRVLASLPGLRKLDIDNAPMLTDASLLALSRKKEMRIIYFCGSPKLSDAAKMRLRAALPSCDIRFAADEIDTSR